MPVSVRSIATVYSSILSEALIYLTQIVKSGQNRIVVGTSHVNSDCFEVKVGMHQGLALNSLLFMIVMKTVSSYMQMVWL